MLLIALFAGLIGMSLAAEKVTVSGSTTVLPLAEAEAETGVVIYCANDELSTVGAAASQLKRSQYRDPRAR